MAQEQNRTQSPGTLTEIAHTLQLVWRLMNDARVPLWPKLIIPAIAIYVLSPLDLLPDLIPLLGQADDAAIIFFGIRFFIDACPADIVAEHRRAIEGGARATGDYVDATYRMVDSDKQK